MAFLCGRQRCEWQAVAASSEVSCIKGAAGGSLSYPKPGRLWAPHPTCLQCHAPWASSLNKSPPGWERMGLDLSALPIFQVNYTIPGQGSLVQTKPLPALSSFVLLVPSALQGKLSTLRRGSPSGTGWLRSPGSPGPAYFDICSSGHIAPDLSNEASKCLPLRGWSWMCDLKRLRALSNPPSTLLCNLR